MSADPLVVTGTVTLDTLHLPSGRHVSVPGGSALFGALGASLVRPCTLVGTAGDDLPAAALDELTGRHIDVSGLRRVSRPTFAWSARYSDDLGHRDTIDRRPGAGTEAPEIPDPLNDTHPWAFLGSMDPRSQQTVLAKLGSGTRYGVDSMRHWITEFGAEVLALVKGADTVFVSVEECELLGAGADTVGSALALLDAGAAHVIVKEGDKGARLFGLGGVRAHCPAVPVTSVVDPTGAGDTLGGAFMAARAEGLDAGQALTRGLAAASFAIEGVSFAGFADLDDEFRRRTQWAIERVS